MCVEVSSGDVKLGAYPQISLAWYRPIGILFYITDVYHDSMPPSKISAHSTEWGQNRRQEIFNMGALRFCGGLYVCAGGLDVLKIDKNSTDL